MRILLFASICMVSTLLFCCSKPQNEVEAALAQAGKNRKELEKVIQHYQQPDDSLKLKAALFLIKQLPLGSNYIGEQVEAYEALFSRIKGLKSGRSIELVFEAFEKQYGEIKAEDLDKVKDVKQISADFLIENIDLAFDAWQKNSWAKPVDFDLFCNGILPYRVENEPLESWRPLFIRHHAWLKDSLRDAPTMQEVFGRIHQELSDGFKITLRWRYPFLPKASHTLDCRIGTCDILSSLIISAARAQGIPAFKDFIPRWGNKDYGHAWAVMLDPKGDPYWCYGEEDTLARNDLPVPSTQLPLDTMGTKYLPFPLEIDSIKTVPKIYRNLFTADPERAKLLQLPYSDEIYGYLKDPRLQDVTRFYLKDCQTIKVTLQDIPSNARFAYLGVFSKQEWLPVAVAPIEGQAATFKDMGQDVLYLPMAFIHNRTIPLGDPFYIKNGKKIDIVINADKREAIHLLRKDPLFANTVNRFNQMVHGHFEGANQPDFSDAETIYTIQKAPVYMDSVELNPMQKFRYVRYVAPPDHPKDADIAEMEFYADENGAALKLSGTLLGTPGEAGTLPEKAIDGDWDSYYKGTEAINWIGLDFGKAQTIRKIRYCPRNDTNLLLPGNTYQLFYWQNQWINAGIQKASEFSLTFHNIPKNALLWLHCINGGREESPFIMQNGRQVFL